MSIKAIVFDLGGVLFKDGKANAVKKLAKGNNYDERIVMDILKSPQAIDLRKGLVSDDDFWKWVQQQLPDGYDALVIKQAWYDGYVLDKGVFNLLIKLHGKYELVVFSGNIKSRVEYLDKKYGFRKFFNLEVYSYDHHFNKPEKGFFEALIRKSGLQPQEMIFIDDTEEAVKPAQEFGINGLVYETGNIHQLENDLRNFGIEF